MKHRKTRRVLAVVGALAAAGATAQARVGQEAEGDLLVTRFEPQEIFVPEYGAAEEAVFVTLMGEQRTLLLTRRSIRSSGFRLLVQSDHGLEEVAAPSVTTYVGQVAEIAGSAVAASIYRGELNARVVLPDGSTHWIQPVPGWRGSQPLHVAYDSRDVLPHNGSCGTAHGAQSHGTPQPVAPPTAAGTAGQCYAVTKIAFDTDFEYFTANGSSTAATVADIEGVMLGVEKLFRDDMEITYEIGTIIVRSSSSDPYVSSESGCTSFGILDEFKAEWNANNGGIDRDVAALFTGKELDGNIIGCAATSTVCNTTAAYSINEAKFSGNQSLRVALVAHELGHNWGASHCDGDSLGCTIMCANIGGCSQSTNFFAPVSDITISNFRAGSTCLSDVVYVDALSTGTNHGTSALPYETIFQGVNCTMSDWQTRDVVITGFGPFLGGVTYGEGPLTINPANGPVRLLSGNSLDVVID